MRAGNHHAEISVTYRSANLVKVACRCKSGVGAENRQLALARQPCSNGCSRLLGNSHAQPALLSLRIVGVELIDGDGAADVQSQAADTGIVAGGAQGFSKTSARWTHINFHAGPGIPPVA